MKKILFASIVLSVTLFKICTAQTKNVYGSFIFAGEIYKYQFKESKAGNALTLMTLEGDNRLPQLDTAKINKTLLQIEEIKDTSATLKQLLQKTKAAILELKQVNELNPTWTASQKDILQLFNKAKHNQQKIDSLILNGTSADSIYNVADLLSLYKDFLYKMNGPKDITSGMFPEMKLDEFKGIFQHALIQLDPDLKTLSGTDSLTSKADQVFYEILTRLKFTDDEPTTAFAILKRKVITGYQGWSLRDEKHVTSFQVNKVELEFEDGTIKNIIAELIPLDSGYLKAYGHQPLVFRNNMPISIAGKFDPERFSNYRIFLGNSRELKKCILPPILPNEANVYFRLSELIDYRYVLETNKEDYSPVNQVIELSEINPVQELRKEKASRLFDARIYTDAVGFNDDQPNGLVQVEISRKVNLVTQRSQGVYICPIPVPRDTTLKHWWFPVIKSPQVNTGFLTNFEVRAAYNKIEKNNQYYIVDSSMVDTTKSFRNLDTRLNLNPLDVMRYRKWTIGVDINLYKLSLINQRTTIQINGYFNYGMTQVADSFSLNKADTSIQKINYQNISNVNWTSYGLGIAAEFKPDSRYNFLFQYDFRWIDIFHPRHNLDPVYGHQYHVAGISGFRKLSQTSEIFFRFKRFWQAGNPKRNFDQIQIGYQLDLFSGAKSEEPNNK